MNDWELPIKTLGDLWQGEMRNVEIVQAGTKSLVTSDPWCLEDLHHEESLCPACYLMTNWTRAKPLQSPVAQSFNEPERECHTAEWGGPMSAKTLYLV